MYRNRKKTKAVNASISYSSLSSLSVTATTTNGNVTSGELTANDVSGRSSPDMFDDNNSPVEDNTTSDEPEPSKKRKVSTKRIGIPQSISPIKVQTQNSNRNDAEKVLRMLRSPQKSPVKKKVRVSRKLNYMEEVVVNAGLQFAEDSFEELNTLVVDQAVFVRDVVKALAHDKRRRTLNQCVENFMDDLNSVFSDKKKFKTALQQCRTDPECNIARGEFQDSLFRLLLSVDQLQPKLLEYLLDKIAEYTAEESHDENDSGIMWTRMILQQLRHLNKIVNSGDVTQRLFDVIHSSPDITVQHEIINCLPDIIGDDQRQQVADELISLMRSEKGVTASVLVALENLCLDSNRMEQLQLSVVKSMRRAPIANLPAFIKFLLSNASGVGDELINGIRSELTIYQVESSGNTQVAAPKSDITSTQILIFERLRDSILMSRKLSETWLKNIGKVANHSQHKPLDIIMLMILHSTSVDQMRKKAVETVFKNKIKTGTFKEELIKDTFTVLIDIIKQNFKDLLKIAAHLLQTNDIVVSQFGAFIYTECFVWFEPQWRKSVVMELLDLARMSNGTRPALTLLHALTIQHQSKISPFITLVMLMLDCVTELTVVETRQLMDILCTVAFGDPDDSSVDTSSFQDEIYMLVQKQLACPDPSVFRSGIVCTVMAIKHMVSMKEGEENPTPEVSDASDEENIVLSGKAKKAFNLLELVLVGTSSNPEALVLTYDQLSYIIMNSSHLDKSFVVKMSGLMQGNLQKHFIIASSDYAPTKDSIESCLQYCLDEDLQDPVALALTESTVRELSESRLMQMPCIALAPLVRCVRALEASDLTEVDALLGCPISLPEQSVLSSFSTLDPYGQRLVLDTLFHAVNWLREIINAFVIFVTVGRPEKVVKRLRLLVYLQGIVAASLPRAIQYQPPSCYFSSTLKTALEKAKKTSSGGGTSKRGRKKKNPEKEKDDEEPSTSTAPPRRDDEAKEDEDDDMPAAPPAPHAAFRHCLREMDFDTCILLALPLTLNPSPIKDGSVSGEFGPKELHFILDDIVTKLRHALAVRKPGIAKIEIGFDHLDSISVTSIVRKFAKLSSHIARHMHAIVEYSHNLIKAHDSIWDAPGMFSPGTAEIKQCLSLILSAFEVFLSWPSVRNECYTKSLTSVLMKLGSVSKEEATSLNAVLQHCVTYLKEMSGCIMDLASGVAIVSLVKTLLTYQDDSEDAVTVDLAEMCSNFLERRWYDAKGEEMKGADTNWLLAALLESYLTSPGDLLARISSIADWLPSQCEALADEPCLTKYPHFNKSNLNVLLRVVCKGLTSAIKTELEGKEYSVQLDIWDSGLTSLQGLTTALKAQDSRTNLRVFLKGSLPILKLFLNQGVNVCSCMFKMESASVTQILKKLQGVTRYIQTVCNYSKVTKDLTMIQQLPVMRGCLESIVLAVKNMVLQNKCTDAFFMGAMKNKGLKGEIIVTQDEDDDDTTADPSTINPESDSADESSEDGEDDGSDSEAC